MMAKIRLKFLAFCCFLAFTLAACGNGSPPGEGKNVQNIAASPTPVQSSDARTVMIDSPDGVRLVGSFYEASKPNSPGLLLLHQWQSDRHSYDDLAKLIQKNGFAVLSLDGRGFGESTKRADGSSVAAGRTIADVKAMIEDVGAALEFLSKQRNVDPLNIGIVGASYGSSLAVLYVEKNQNVRSVVMISPGLNYFGTMPIEPVINSYGERWLFVIAAEDDKESANAVRKLNVTKKGPSMMEKIFPAGGHGTALLRNEDALKDVESHLMSMILNPVHH